MEDLEDQLPAPLAPGLHRWKARATSCIGVMLMLGLGCNGDSESSVEAMAGGWSNEMAHLYACISQDRRMWLGDVRTELAGPNPCTLADSGAEFHCPQSEAQSAFDGAIDVSGDQLTLEVAPCSSSNPSECRATYTRDSTLTCD